MKAAFHGLLLAAICGIIWPASSSGQTLDMPVVVLVRHADRTSEPPDDPVLTAAGFKRAEELAATLQDAGITAIITTNTRRSRDTASPLASKLGLKPEVFPLPAKGQKEEREQHFKSIEEALRRQKGGVVLVVGHETTVPGIIASLGGPQMPNICPSVYDRLFVLLPSPNKPTLVQARYGPPTHCE